MGPKRAGPKQAPASRLPSARSPSFQPPKKSANSRPPPRNLRRVQVLLMGGLPALALRAAPPRSQTPAETQPAKKNAHLSQMTPASRTLNQSASSAFIRGQFLPSPPPRTPAHRIPTCRHNCHIAAQICRPPSHHEPLTPQQLTAAFPSPCRAKKPHSLSYSAPPTQGLLSGQVLIPHPSSALPHCDTLSPLSIDPSARHSFSPMLFAT